MATIDEILDAMPDENAETGRDYLVIDPLTRTIIVPGSEMVFGVTGDELADRKYFMCPRYVGDGLDLAGMFIRVNYRNAGGDEDGYLVDDVAVVGDYVTFSWRLWPKVTEYMGTIHFGVCADLPNTAERRFPDWNTTMATGEVLEGLHPYDGAVEEETRDVVTQLRAETAAQTAAVTACGAEQVQAVKDTAAAETAAAVAAVKAQGAATQASLPADYTALAAQVDKLTRDRAAAIVCEAKGTAIQVQDAGNDPLQGLRIFGRSTQDGTPNPDNPVEIVSTPAPVVTVCGKNLLKNEAVSSTAAGITFTVNADGSITANGTSSAVSPLIICKEFLFKAGVAYKLTGCPAGGSTSTYRIDNMGTLYDDGNGGHITCATDTVATIRIRIAADVTVNNLTFRPMIRFASIEDDTYEPYKGGTLTITTPGSLPGIPVASGGNYTDANGQEWICDEVDLARGVYVQRTGTLVLTGSVSEHWGAYNPAEGEKVFHCYLVMSNYARRWPTTLCDKFRNVASVWEVQEYGLFSDYNTSDLLYFSAPNAEVTDLGTWKAWLQANPVTIVYLLAEPIETALNDAELQAYRTLCSYKPTTTVLTDAGAHMVLEYAADPKTYIDNKLAALVAANN